MSSIVVAGDTSGSVTISAPAVAGTPTLTLPTTSGTVVATSGGYVPTSQLGSGSASSSTYLRGDQSWATISSGGMTLLGTLTTTSGTTQTLSGLTLTNYKFLQVSFNNVGFLNGATGVAGTLNSVAITRPFLTQTESMAGVLFLDLSTGAFFGPGFGLTTTNTSTYQFVSAGNIAISTSTTSLSFGLSGEPFNRGTIKVYGVA